MRRKQSEKATSYRAYRTDLRTGQFKNFLRYLFPSLPQLSLSSLNAGLGTANLATAVVGLGGIAVVGVAGVTLVGSAVVSGVCAGMGTLAVVLGIASLKKEYDKNKEEVKAVVGDRVQEGQAGELKKMLAYLTYTVAHNPEFKSAELDALLLSLAAIRGNGLREKCYDVYDIDEGNVVLDEEELCNEMRAILDPENQKNISPQSLRIALGILSEKFENTLQLFTQEINAALEDGDRAQIQSIIGKLSEIPGGSLQDKINCLYGPESQEIDATRLHNAVKSEIEQQYFELLIAYDEIQRGIRREDLTPRINAFKMSLSLLDGIDNKSKMALLFGATPLQSYSAATAFKEAAKRYLTRVTEVTEEEQEDAESTPLREVHRFELPIMNPAQLKNAKTYMENELFNDSFMTPLDYGKKYFNALAGGMTGFGIVISISALAGVSIATGGVGLGVLIGAIVLAAVGFSLAVWYTNYTKKRDLRIKNEIHTAKNIITNVCEHGNNYLDQVYEQENRISSVSELDFAPEDELDHDNAPTADQQKIWRLTREIERLRAQLPQAQEKGKEELNEPPRNANTGSSEEPQPSVSPRQMPLLPVAQTAAELSPETSPKKKPINPEGPQSPSMKKHGHFKNTTTTANENIPTATTSAEPNIDTDPKKH